MPGGILLSVLLMHANRQEHASMESHNEHQIQLPAQQVKALNPPTFESFPYLTTRVVPALYHLENGKISWLPAQREEWLEQTK